MGRSAITIRAAGREDSVWLAELWSDLLRRADRSELVADLELIVKRAAASPEERLVVAELDGEPAGAVLLRLATVGPLNLEACVQAVHPRVVASARRRGIGKALMEAATGFAEDNGVLLMSAVVPSPSRESNRFLARLGLGQAGVWRIAPTSVVRGRLTPKRAAASSPRQRILAARRSARRTRPAEEVGGLSASEDGDTLSPPWGTTESD